MEVTMGSKVKINNGTIVEGQDFSDMTGEVSFKYTNNMICIDLDESSIGKLSNEFIEKCKALKSTYKSIILEKDEVTINEIEKAILLGQLLSILPEDLEITVINGNWKTSCVAGAKSTFQHAGLTDREVLRVNTNYNKEIDIIEMIIELK